MPFMRRCIEEGTELVVCTLGAEGAVALSAREGGGMSKHRVDAVPVEVLDRVRKVAESGFARGVTIIESFDPSLPPVSGDRDQLIQVFLNLVRNASDALPETGGVIELTTAYQHGVRLAVPGGGRRVHLPLVVSVRDNGSGIPEEIRPSLFDPFVTSKRTGSGLGLALVAKLVGDHGGLVEYDSRPGRTVFRVHLPVQPSASDETAP